MDYAKEATEAGENLVTTRCCLNLDEEWLLECFDSGGNGFDDQSTDGFIWDGYVKIGDTKYCDSFENYASYTFKPQSSKL